MGSYTVRWVIDAVEAKNPVEAAKFVLTEFLRNSESEAVVFCVIDEDDGVEYEIDLLNDDPVGPVTDQPC